VTALKPVDRLEITVLVDNSIDTFLPSTDEVRRPRLTTGHCTGWKATHALARELPEAFVQPSVGTRLLIESGSVNMSE